MKWEVNTWGYIYFARRLINDRRKWSELWTFRNAELKFLNSVFKNILLYVSSMKTFSVRARYGFCCIVFFFLNYLLKMYCCIFISFESVVSLCRNMRYVLEYTTHFGYSGLWQTGVDPALWAPQRYFILKQLTGGLCYEVSCSHFPKRFFFWRRASLMVGIFF